ncbi:hypothetical protein [Mycolicibacterium fortuitum]|jgi:hypothetical protein|uniref:Uncharacterized protein n=4 Tax=Mycolicibacterium fortuitum TaxID=1766 RepID=A0A378UX85_MYCFO|nr:hypothetical protein [Mycolicibacterium fortuitum]CRL73960.1 hypothetical protein CPGR_01193 [Mycolicibacter nonchromogenicus]MDV7190058.1 hypothetical protein [Mycolicibacterium fortuitum]MDV7205820.1 hypothetical protein [Mycolicibacterium fortuitum]MDV7226102.1 hypothetical protein [Mycolicibacterium fortuitum]MDV7258591.1 hypothetical protein [Mycolicibacterium fortuitum]
MTTPPGPPEDVPPPGDEPPAFGPQSFEPQGIPPAYHGDPSAPPTQPPGYPPYQYPPGYPYGPPPQPERRISVPMVIIGPFLYAALNLMIGFAAFISAGAADSGGGSANAVLGAAAVLLAFIAFGGGTVMLFSKSPTARGLGIGLMVGWALVSLVTAGFCTGINPELYAL